MLPGVIEGFYGNSHLKELQMEYPIAELMISLGMIVVMFFEKAASFVHALRSVDKKKDNNKQSNATENSSKGIFYFFLSYILMIGLILKD